MILPIIATTGQMSSFFLRKRGAGSRERGARSGKVSLCDTSVDRIGYSSAQVMHISLHGVIIIVQSPEMRSLCDKPYDKARKVIRFATICRIVTGRRTATFGDVGERQPCFSFAAGYKEGAFSITEKLVGITERVYGQSGYRDTEILAPRKGIARECFDRRRQVKCRFICAQ